MVVNDSVSNLIGLCHMYCKDNSLAQYQTMNSLGAYAMGIKKWRSM